LREVALALVLSAVLTSSLSAGTAVTAIEIPLFLDAREVEQIPAFFSKAGAFLGGRRGALRPGAAAASAARKARDLSGRIDATGKLSPDAIAAPAASTFFFDAAHLEARVGIPASRRPVSLWTWRTAGKEAWKTRLRPPP